MGLLMLFQLKSEPILWLLWAWCPTFPIGKLEQCLKALPWFSPVEEELDCSTRSMKLSTPIRFSWRDESYDMLAVHVGGLTRWIRNTTMGFTSTFLDKTTTTYCSHLNKKACEVEKSSSALPGRAPILLPYANKKISKMINSSMGECIKTDLSFHSNDVISV